MNTEPLALPMVYDGQPLVPFLARWTLATADTTRAVSGLEGTPYDVPRGLGRGIEEGSRPGLHLS